MKTTTRRSVLKAGATAAAAFAGFGASPSTRQARPNVLFILSDDQRSDTIHARGNAQIITPSLDRLCSRGVCLGGAHIMGGTQPAVCMPSRSMILTGRSIYRSPDQPRNLSLWPQVLRDSGYATFITGKWHNGPAALARCFSAGDNIFFGGMSNQGAVKVQSFDPSGRYSAARARAGARFSSELFADSAVEFLRNHKETRPFMMWVAFTAPHDPRTPPEQFAAMYDPAKLPLPANFMSRHPFDNGELDVRDEKLLPTPREPAAVRREIAAYYGMISHMDQQIGRILDALRESGHDNDTIIVFASDNGLALGSHGLLGKQSLYEHSVRVPLIIAGPDLPRGITRDGPCYLFDLFPTICDALRLDIPSSVEGRSVLPLIRGESPGRESMFFAYRTFQHAVTDGRYKFIRYDVNSTTRLQLFDLRDDPLELKDLASDPAHADALARTQKLLADWRRRLDPTKPAMHST